MPHDYTFRKMTRADYPMFRDWLSNPHIAGWWEDGDTELRLIDEEIDGGPCDMRIVHCDGKPFAFVQDYRIHAYGGPQFKGLPERAHAMDMFLGDPAYLGKGHAARFLRQRAYELCADGAPLVAVDPDPENARAIATYRRAGFTEHATRLCEDGDPVLVMTWTPEQKDQDYETLP
jgi:aminoglycoside 6'-N-acetyltransferase